MCCMNYILKRKLYISRYDTIILCNGDIIGDCVVPKVSCECELPRRARPDGLTCYRMLQQFSSLRGLAPVNCSVIRFVQRSLLHML